MRLGWDLVGVCIWWESGVRWSVLYWCFLQESAFSSREAILASNLVPKILLQITCFHCDLQI
jgi:hypothetical protein